MHNKNTLKRIVVLVIAALFLAISLYLGKMIVQFLDQPEQFRQWVDGRGIYGPLIFVLMVTVQVIVAIIPGGPFQVAGGYAFGSFGGTVLCLVGCTLGSMIVFLLVRKYGRKFVLLFFSEEKIQQLEARIDSTRRNRLLALIFIIPGTPKDLLSYYAGLTDIKITTWFLICSLGRLPAILLSALSGSAAQKTRYTTALIVLGVIIVISGIGALIYYRMNKRKR